MLQEAKNPVCGGTHNVQLIQSNLHDIELKSAFFDLIICIGVFGLYCPLDEFALQKIVRFIRPGGRVFLTATEHEPVSNTWKRKMAKGLKPLVRGPVARYVNARLHEFDLDKETLMTLVSRYLTSVHIVRWVSPTGRVDLHCTAKMFA